MANGLPIVVADPQHAMHEKGQALQPYLLQASPGLMLDSTQFTLLDPDRHARLPNSVHVVYDGSALVADWPQTGTQIAKLDKTSLRTIKGAGFSGFRSGSQAFIAIGYQQTPPGSTEVQFTPFWMTSIVFH